MKNIRTLDIVRQLIRTFYADVSAVKCATFSVNLKCAVKLLFFSLPGLNFNLQCSHCYSLHDLHIVVDVSVPVPMPVCVCIIIVYVIIKQGSVIIISLIPPDRYL